MAIAAVIVLLLLVLVWDNVANYGKAYGNVFINGQSVAGKTADEMRTMLEEDFGARLSSGDVRIYASEKAQKREGSSLSQQEDRAQAEQISVEEAKAAVTSWVTKASGLRAQVPYDDAIQKALDAGRSGGLLSRLKLFVAREDIELGLSFDDKAIEDLSNAIDATIGDQRIDSTVEIIDGYANAVKGHDGKMVNREWLKEKLTKALLSENEEETFVAQVEDAPSRTTYEQAQDMATCINKALNSGLAFKYRTQSWTADGQSIGNWTKVDVAQVPDGYELRASVDTSTVTSDLIKHLDASSSGEGVVVDFEAADGQVTVKTSGTGVIPEVGPAVAQVSDTLYGPTGVAFSNEVVSNPTIEVNESNAPETLTFEQAVDLGIITVIGEYTTEFSNSEGTENRNHNIKLAADLLNNSVCNSGGGIWSFNEHSGDTNQDPPFESAGSIVDGEYVDSIGGGICQVATTIFNAVYEAGLDINERKNHSLYIASYPTGRDAAVSYPEMDFVWSNPHTSDALLTLSYTDTTITAKLYSTPLGYKVTTETGEWEEGEKYHTEYETDEDLPEGSYYLKTTGSDGSQITVTRTVTDMAGNIVKEDSFPSVYAPKNEVYSIGPGTDTSEIEGSNSDSGNTNDEDDSYDDENEYEDESEYENESSSDEYSYDDEEY